MFAVAVLAVALYAAATVSPATGAGRSAVPSVAEQVASCVPALSGDSLFSVYDKLTPAAFGRGFDAREPADNSVVQDLPASAIGQAGPNFSATVPVYFHVVTDGSIGDLTDKQISDQMTVLNLEFAGMEGGANTGFSFTLAGVTHSDNADWFYAKPGGINEKSMKRALHQGGNNALNPVLDHGRPVPGLGVSAGHRHEARPGVHRRDRVRLGDRPGGLHDLRGHV
jgi:hypothetical protein